MSQTDGQIMVHEPAASDYGSARPIAGGENDREWYKRAVFYEVLVRAFADSNGDGTGDLRGLIDKLDYLSWLGVDCLWLPPFYDSPLRDGGYDISDYRKVLPEFGKVEDFVALLDAAHERGIRVIIDLVMNHTSDAHRWFQESRHHPDGPVRRLLRLARRRHRLSGRADHLRRHRAQQLDLRPGPQAVLLAPVLLPPARSELREPRRRRRDDRHPAVLARSRARRFPAGRGAVPLRGGGHERREPAEDPRIPQAVPQGAGHRIPERDPAGRGQPVAGRCRRLLRRPGGRRRRVPHVLPLPA